MKRPTNLGIFSQITGIHSTLYCRPNDQQAVDAIEAIGFRDYCLGLHGVIEGEPQQKLKRTLQSKP